jgi:geranylgeranyl pyrophosphate synthase
MEDLLAEKKSSATAAEIEFIHVNKTAAMIEAAFVMGGLTAGADAATLAALRNAGRHLGYAFQIIDDVLDATADTATLGKTAGKDAKANKATVVRLHGLASARELATKQSAKARDAITALPGDTKFLVALADSMASRAS